MKFKEYNKEKLKSKSEEFVVIDMQNKTINRKNITKQIGKDQDDKVLAFTILYNY